MKRLRIIPVITVMMIALCACGIKKMPQTMNDVTVYPLPAPEQVNEPDLLTEAEPEVTPEPVVTPEPTPEPEVTPEPDATPEPTPVPVDCFDDHDPYSFDEGKPKKKSEKDVVYVVKGATRLLPETDALTEKFKVKISDKGLLKRVKVPKSNRQLINKYTDQRYKGVYVRGLRTGISYVTVKTKDNERTYTVIVESKKSVRKEARKALNKRFSKLSPGADSMVFFTDMDSDGISDLYAEGKIFLYRYETGAVGTIDLGFDPGIINSIYVSKKYGIVYVVLSPEADLKVCDGAAKIVGRLILFDKSKISAPQQPIDLYQDSVSFFFHDPGYGQENLSYDGFNVDDWKQLMKKLKLKQIGGEIKG